MSAISGKLGRRNRRSWLHLAAHAPHVALIIAGLARLHNLPQLT